MTLTLKFDLLLKNFNLGHIFQTRRDRGFHIAHVYSLGQDPSPGTIIFDVVTLTLKFNLFLKNIDFCCYLMMVAARRASLSSDNSYFSNLPSFTQNLINMIEILPFLYRPLDSGE